MPRQYPPHFSRELVNRMVAGESVISLVEETAVPERTLYRWKQQALINAGLKDGPDSQESAEPRAAKKRIRALENELQLVKDPSELFDAQAVVPPLDDRPSQKDS
jgi:transposase-like protein